MDETGQGVYIVVDYIIDGVLHLHARRAIIKCCRRPLLLLLLLALPLMLLLSLRAASVAHSIKFVLKYMYSIYLVDRKINYLITHANIDWSHRDLNSNSISSLSSSCLQRYVCTCMCECVSAGMWMYVWACEKKCCRSGMSKTACTIVFVIDEFSFLWVWYAAYNSLGI